MKWEIGSINLEGTPVGHEMGEEFDVYHAMTSAMLIKLVGDILCDGLEWALFVEERWG